MGTETAGAHPQRGHPDATHRPVPDWHGPWMTALDGFIKDLAQRGYSEFTRRDYRMDCLRLAGYVEIHPDDLNADHLASVAVAMEAEGVSLNARRRRLSAYNRFLDYLGAMDHQPMMGAQILTVSEGGDPVDRLLVALVYLAGLRPSEIAGLEGRDFRLRRGVVVARSGMRIIPLHEGVVRLIKEARCIVPHAAYRPIIPGLNGFAANARTLHGRFQRFVDRWGFEHLKPEAVRREVSVHLRRHGVPPGLVKAFLGKDRGRPVAPRRGGYVDLTCLSARIAELPVTCTR